MSDLAFDPSSGGPIAGSRTPLRWRSLLKTGAAGAILAAAAYAVLSGQGFVNTDNAVVSTYIVSLRAPVSGYVSGVRAGVGQAVTAGTVLAHLDEPRVDEQRLVDLQRLATRLGADLAALRFERDALSRQRDALVARAARRNVSEAELLTLQAAEAERQARARQAAGQDAARVFGRARALAESGSISMAALDGAESAADEAGRNAEAALVRVAYLRLQAQAARDGMLLENGSNDVPYSRQRADELAIRIAELDREIAFSAASQAETAGRLQSERRRMDLLRSADLIAPSSGMLWKLGAANGERLSVGDTAAEIVDCKAAFVIAAIPQERYSDVEIGGLARIRLSGERTDRRGHVMSITGEATLANDRNLAAAPLMQRQATATARIGIDGSADDAGGCLVGRTARVLLPTSPDSGILARLGRSLL